jgi:hypothetical protein
VRQTCPPLTVLAQDPEQQNKALKIKKTLKICRTLCDCNVLRPPQNILSRNFLFQSSGLKVTSFFF